MNCWRHYHQLALSPKDRQEPESGDDNSVGYIVQGRCPEPARGMKHSSPGSACCAHDAPPSTHLMPTDQSEEQSSDCRLGPGFRGGGSGMTEFVTDVAEIGRQCRCHLHCSHRKGRARMHTHTRV